MTSAGAVVGTTIERTVLPYGTTEGRQHGKITITGSSCHGARLVAANSISILAQNARAVCARKCVVFVGDNFTFAFAEAERSFGRD